MNKDDILLRLMEYMEGQLSERERREIEDLLHENKEVQQWYAELKELNGVMSAANEWKPSTALQDSFDALLLEEQRAASKGSQVFFTPMLYKVAAAILVLVLAGGIGFWYSREQAKDKEIAALRAEMEKTRELVFSMLHNELSASQRMMGVKAAYETTRHDDAIVLALISVMNNDANMNVRLSAVEALGKFSDEANVRKALIESLPEQNDPAVQIALIQVLVQMKEKEAVKSLKKIIEDEHVIESVRDEAYAGMIKMNI